MDIGYNKKYTHFYGGKIGSGENVVPYQQNMKNGHNLTGLSVCKNAGVVSLKCVVKDIAPQAVEHHILGRIVFVALLRRVEAMVKSERFRLLPENKKSMYKNWATQQCTALLMDKRRIFSMFRFANIYNFLFFCLHFHYLVTTISCAISIAL